MTRTLARVVALGACVASAQGAVAQVLHEIKIGALYHDVPGLWSGFQLEPRSADISVEVLLSPNVHLLGGTLRPAIGASINTHRATSRAYVDARWEIDGPARTFLALGIGAALHDGETGPFDPFRKALGSRLLFHFPAEVGWRFDGHNSVSLYFEHVSNGYTQDFNEGLDAIGVRYGHRF